MLGAMLVLICFVVAHMAYLAQDRLPGLLPHLLRPPAARWSRAAAAAAAAAPGAAAASAIVPGAGARSPIDFVFNPSRLNLPAEAEQSDATVTMAGVCDKRGMMNWPVCKDWLKRWERRFPERPVVVGEHMQAVFLEAQGGGAAAALAAAAAGAAAAAPQPLPPPPPPPAAPEDEAPLTLGGEHAGERTGTDVFALAPHGSGGGADGDHADLDGHRGNEQCWRHFDLGFLEDWDAAARMMCTPAGGQWEGVEGEASAKLGPPYSAAAPAGAARLPSAELAAALAAPAASAPPGWLRCRVISDAHLPGPTAPHTLCDGANVYLFPARLSPTACLPSRPGYKCAGPPIHWAYAPGALAAACDAARPAFAPEAFPRDHLRDMFGSWGAGGALAEALAGEGGGGIEEAGGEFVLLVAREREEHANAFHATTDWLNAYIALALAGVVDARTGRDSASGGGMARVQVLLLDEQSGPFEDAWYGRVLSRGAHPVLRVSALQARGVRALRMRRALFVPPGYTNMLLSHVASEGDCHAGTALLQGYRAFVLAGLGLAPLPPQPSARGSEGGAGGGAPLRVLLISRRPYSAAGIEHGFVGRQIDNEDSLLTGLRQALDGAGLARGAEVERLDLALLDAREQAAAVALRCDVLLGMHGAALTYAALLPPWAGVVELWPKQGDIWRCFEHLAAMAGLFYERWENGEWGAWREDASGDYTRVDVGAVAAKVIAAARHAEAWQAPVG